MPCWYDNVDTDEMGYDDDTEGEVRLRQKCPHCEEYAPQTWETGPRGSYYQCPSCHTKYGVEE